MDWRAFFFHIYWPHALLPLCNTLDSRRAAVPTYGAYSMLKIGNNSNVFVGIYCVRPLFSPQSCRITGVAVGRAHNILNAQYVVADSVCGWLDTVKYINNRKKIPNLQNH